MSLIGTPPSGGLRPSDDPGAVRPRSRLGDARGPAQGRVRADPDHPARVADARPADSCAWSAVERVRAALPAAVEKHMFGGAGFMVDGRWRAPSAPTGCSRGWGRTHQADLVLAEGVEPMVMGRPRERRGWVRVQPLGRSTTSARCRTWSGPGRWPAAHARGWRRRGHEVDELLDPAQQLGLEVRVRRGRCRGCAATRGRGRPASRAASRGARATPCLPRRAARDVRPGVHAQAVRPDGLPDVDVRVADDEHVLGERAHRPGLPTTRHSLVPGTRWSTSTPIRRPGPGRERRAPRPRGRRRRRGARRRRPRPAGRRPTPSRRARRRAGPRRRSATPRATRARAPWTATEPLAVRAVAPAPRERRRPPGGVGQRHGGAVDEEARAEAEAAGPSVAVLEVHDVHPAGLLDAHDRTAPRRSRRPRRRCPSAADLGRAAARRRRRSPREHVVAVPVHHGGEASRVGRSRPRGRAGRRRRATASRRIGTPGRGVPSIRRGGPCPRPIRPSRRPEVNDR